MAHSSDSITFDVALPVYNEQKTLERSVHVLHEYLSAEYPAIGSAPGWRITIADNASTDDTAAIADRLADELAGVVAVHLPEKGRGRALRRVWMNSPAEVVAYLDIDLSTDLTALPPLIAPLLSGHSDVAIGTRLARTSRVVRGAKREFISRSYNLLLRGTMAVKFSDAQCGFKAIRTDVAHQLVPLVEDEGWFFDTELLIIAERSGLRIHEVPVDWVDDPDSTVDVVSTAREDLKGMFRVGRSILTGKVPVERIYAELGRRPFEQPQPPSFFGQVVRFGVVGALSTAAYALFYLGFQHIMPGQLANFLALLITAIANTAANRRFTFGVQGRAGAAKHQFQGLVVFGLSWAITSGALFILTAENAGHSAHLELLVLTVANLVATVLRFVLLRVWVFRSHRADPVAASERAEGRERQEVSR
jgi:putative flippase GtrA/glycosyltransferase involved in cell wall biosynthesis